MILAWILIVAAAQEPEAAAQEPAPSAAEQAPPLAPAPAGYGDPDQVPERLRALAEASGARLIELARSAAGRPVLAISFGERQDAGRPEVLIVANLEGDRLAASEVALALCERFAAAGSALPTAAGVHVVPLANPDAAARAFAGAEPWRGAPADEDRDGLLDEDGPRDLDGDGRALWMRVPDPAGEMLPDPADPRATRAAKKDEGEAGGWRLLREGADADGDREHAEDGDGGARLDRNFPQRWREHRTEAGPFPLSEPEARGLADFLLAHPHAAVTIVLDDEDNSASPPKGGERLERDAGEVLEDDAGLLRIWSKRLYGEDGKGAGAAKPRGAPAADGGFADWAYFQVGAQVIESGLWSAPREKSLDGAEDLDEDASDEARELRWFDARCAGAGFAPWREQAHPRWGTVQVGGWLPLVRENPPHEELAALTERWGGFCDGLAADFAQLEWRSVEIADLGGGAFEARATLVNVGLLPTASAAGAVNERPRPLRVHFEAPDGELLSGRPVQGVDRLEGLGGAREFRWIYRPGRAGARIRASSQTAGVALHVLNAEEK